MNVLSLFDGMSCGQLALRKAGILYDSYFASEINTSAIAVTKHNFPETQHIGDIRNISSKVLPKIDLLIGGSPCQGFSFAGELLNFNDERSKLFFEFVRLKNELNPKYFIFENVNMKAEFILIISQLLKAAPRVINSNLFSAQNRTRIYWSNIPYDLNVPGNNQILKDILEETVDVKYINDYDFSVRLMNNQVENKHITKCTDQISYNLYGTKVTLQKNITKADTGTYVFSCGRPKEIKRRSSKQKQFKVPYSKHCCLLASNISGVLTNGFIRKLTPIEYERLQTVPDNYSSIVPDNHRYQMLGNGWTVDVIANIFSSM